MAASGSRPTGKIMAEQSQPGPGPDDAALAIEARSNPEAFGALYERHVAPIFRYCLIHLDSREAAEDATSQVFLKALGAIGDFRGGLFLAWIYRIARNEVADAYRRHRPTQPLDVVRGILDATPTPEDFALSCAERTALQSAIVKLPDDQRAVIELQLAGWSTQRMAEALARSPAAVKMLRFRALNRLRSTLASAGWISKEAIDE